MKQLGIKTRAGLFVGLAAVTIVLCHINPNAAINPETGMVMRLPGEIPGSEGVEVPIGELEMANLPDDTTMHRRVYREYGYSERLKIWRQLTATLVLMGSDRRSLHEPEFCLRALGWKVEPGKVVRVETKGGPLAVKELVIKKWLRDDSGQFLRDARGNKVRVQGHYFYWWVGRDGSTPHSKVRIARSVLNNMLRNVNDRWGYPSVQVLADPRLPLAEGSEEARTRALDFIRDYAPEFQKSLGARDLKAGRNGGG